MLAELVEELLNELELELLDTLDTLLDEELLDEDKSSIERIDSRSALFGPGNWSEPVWKFRTSTSLTSPVDLVSVRVACQI